MKANSQFWIRPAGQLTVALGAVVGVFLAGMALMVLILLFPNGTKELFQILPSSAWIGGVIAGLILGLALLPLFRR